MMRGRMGVPRMMQMVSGVGSDRGLEGADDAMALAVAGSKQLPFLI